MQPITIQFAVRVGYLWTIILWISRENNIIQIDLQIAAPAPCHLHVYLGDVWRRPTSADWLNCFNNIYKMENKIGFGMSLIVVEAIRGRCASFMVLTATVSEIFRGQTNSYFSSTV